MEPVRVTDRIDADAPAFSENVAGLAVALSEASLSLTVNVVVALANPVAEAVIVTIEVPSAMALSIAAIVAVAVVWPAGMVTVAGTVALSVLDDDSVTICSAVDGPVRVTVSVDAEVPAFSENAAGLALTLKIASLSLTVSVVVASANPVADAVIVTVAGPSAMSLSTAAIVAVAVVWPAGMVTVAGTVALLVFDDVSVTI